MPIRRIRAQGAFRALVARPFEFSDAECTLGKRTLIFGRNGSGKSTLSELLRIECSDIDRRTSNPSVEVAGSGQWRWTPLTPALDGRVFVYNRFFVEETLEAFVGGIGSSPAIVVKLGAENVRSERRVRALEEYSARLDDRERRVAQVQRTLATNQESIERTVQSEIISALSKGDAGTYNTTRFTVAGARKALEAPGEALLDAETLASRLAVANEPPLDEIGKITSPPVLESGFFRSVSEGLLGVEVDLEPLPHLAADNLLAGWVEQGLVLHEVGQTCKFCREGVVSAEVLSQYRKHFSDSLQALRVAILSKIRECESISDDLIKFEQGLPQPTHFLVENRQAAEQQISALTSESRRLRGRLSEATTLLSARLADPLHPVRSDESMSGEALNLDLAPLWRLIERNDEKCAHQASQQRATRRAVEKHFGAFHRRDHLATIDRLDRADRAIRVIKRVSASTRVEVRRLQAQQNDTTHMATLIDRDLRTDFGLLHLSVAPSADGKGYEVLREGKTAVKLSEGERNAIALTYFLRSLEGMAVNASSSTVVIDDPMTSLDKEALFAAFAMVMARTRKFEQAIFLTHDFEFFRLLLNEHRRRLDKSRGKIKDGNKSEEEFPAVRVLEVIARMDPVALTRESHVREIPDLIVRHASEYHYLFFKVATAVASGDEGEYPLLGNAARRLIEGFLSFKGPASQDFQAKVDTASQDQGVDPVLTKRVVKFLHGQSHREEPRPGAGLDFPAIDQELRAVLSFMQLCDAKHFERMCDATAVDKQDLANALATQ